MGIQGQRLHICYPNDPAIPADEGNAQGDERIFHPKTVMVFCFKDEEHSLVFTQGSSTHQSKAPLLWCSGDLYRDFLMMDIERNFQDILGICDGNPEEK
jgi:hypothetical protein